jgi:hypothetical protein
MVTYLQLDGLKAGRALDRHDRPHGGTPRPLPVGNLHLLTIRLLRLFNSHNAPRHMV